MPRKAKRACRYPGCSKVTESASGYCYEHECEQRKHYDRYIRSATHNERYGSTWRRLRGQYIKEHPLCEECKQRGKYTLATEVHHKKALSAGGTNAEENLMSLCKKCHSRITLRTENQTGR